MSRSRRAPTLFLPLLLAAMLALSLLASLQYHWVGQVSDGERERRQASLTLGAERFSQDFNRELARAYLTFQMDAATLRDKTWSRFDRRYERWQEGAPYPGLVEAIYLVEVNQIGRVKLSRFNPDQSRFEPESWPYEMLPMRRRFERAYRQIFAVGDGARINIEPVDAVAPAVLVPVARPGLLSVQQDLGIDADLLFSDLLFPGTFSRCLRCPPELYDTPLLAHTIVMLDTDYISGTMLSDLAQRHFPVDGLDYNLAVLDRADRGRLIFRSDDHLSAGSFARADAAVGIFDITYDDLNALMLASDPRLDDESTTDQSERIAIGVLGRPGETAQAAGDAGKWQLVLQHRSGSLEGAVNNLRTRNLLISAGTLLLLGGSVAMLLVSTRRAQRLAQQQIEFASAVSHELRTPLAVICSAGENLADGLIHDPQKARQYGLVISNEGRRLAEMVEQVLAFAGAQSGQQRYALHPADLAEVVRGAIQAMQHQLREGGFTLDLTLAPDLPQPAVDALALRRSVQNLVSNAMKYGGDDGWIGVALRVAPGEHGEELQISVSDHGIGIEPADLPHILEPFYRGRSASTNQTHGSGLGLSLVRHTVEAHGGRISVSSEIDRGSRFTLHLPLPAVAALPARQPATPVI